MPERYILATSGKPSPILLGALYSGDVQSL
jgi:hypothetical protein